MTKIRPEETEITGRWVVAQGRVVADAACQRIEDLTRVELQPLGADESGWDMLYRDPGDGRLWERTFPQSGLQGGGPPKLSVISVDDARKKYGSKVTGD